ncbi:Alpha/Beta hydrolase protein [Crepidotus variabilis]|uniref:Alpha/Beta hydrolase protein n=1 Tax=Crepidotus variabilis TaxID=179855 RepID=A0A9P6EK44_9AGAR|nr:Alpha/Beta hydrolase protein [Crepidotus variabilis]
MQQAIEPPSTRKRPIPIAHLLLEAKRAAIDICAFQAVYFDVYYPPAAARDVKDECSIVKCTPTLVFFSGGGFLRGSRSSLPLNLAHNNLGAFFAAKGILTIIPDYRLVPSITFPQGSVDVRDAFQWVVKNSQRIEANSNHLYVLAHSAGGIHVSGCLLTPSLFEPVAKYLRGITFLGVPITISHHIAQFPPILNLRAACEPRLIRKSIYMFTQTLVKKGVQVEELVLAGHDHMSPIMALSSGYGGEWGDNVAEWILGARYLNLS